MGLLIAAALAVFTTYKLHKMARIRGFIGEVPTERYVVSGKTRGIGRVRPSCYVWCSADTTGRGGEHRVQADCDYWEQLRILDPIELVRLDGDDELFLRQGGVYTSAGNFGFDFVLLAFELAAVAYGVLRLIRGTREPVEQ